MFTMNKNYLWWHKNIKLSYTQCFFNVQGMHFKAYPRLTVDTTTVVEIIATIIIILIQEVMQRKSIRPWVCLVWTTTTEPVVQS